MSKLALLGGSPIREKSIPWVSTMGEEEMAAVVSVMKTGTISAFFGRAGDQFLGGPKVLEIERDFAQKFGTAYAISVNSATTALHTAVAACETGPGDEVLVTPFTMAATASVILMNNAIPVFVDIDPHTYNLNPEKLEQWITPRTKAIIAADIFGLPANWQEIVHIARKHGLFVIADCAQSPGASIEGKQSGTQCDLAVFSLNYHKVIHSGEGGIIVTDSKDLAHRCQLMRNHGEVVVDDYNDHETVVLGSNYRMSELHAAIGTEQLKKLDTFLISRRTLANQLSNGLKSFEGLTGVTIPKGYEHSYYVYPIQFHHAVWGISRNAFAQAMKAEGFPLGIGYVKPVYLLPIYQHKKVYNQTTFPFSLIEHPIQKYEKGICPVAEMMFDEVMLVADVCRLPFTSEDIEGFLEAAGKIWNERGRLYEFENQGVSRA